MKDWQLAPKAPQRLFQQHPALNPILLQLLFNRGIKEKEEIDVFLSDHLPAEKTLVIGDQAVDAFYDPFLFRDMAAAVELIISHIKAGDQIVVYGDYDADGVTATVILLETLKILHAQAEVYLPDRVSEGYGLNRAAIDQIASQGGKLIITVDNGIRNKEEVAYAKSLGLNIIITDHHVLPEEAEERPDCLIINPADPQDRYPWPYLAGVGVAFKLVSALLHKANLSSSQKQLILEKSLDLVAVGTVADMVNLLGENRFLVRRGLEILNRNKRLGLGELIKIAKINSGRKLEAWNIGWQIGPRLNAASRLSHANTAFALLATTDQEEAKALASELNQRNLNRQQITEEIISQVEKQIDPDNLPPLIIGLAGEDQLWNEGVIGLVAGRITEKYYRPTLIITRLIEEAGFDPETNKLIATRVAFKGSGRSIEEFNLIEAIEAVSQNLEKYGGHPMACGFSIKSEDDLESFKARITALAADRLDALHLKPKLKIESELLFSDLDLDFLSTMNLLAPYGQNNPQPRFLSRQLLIGDIVTMGFESQHIKFRLSQPAQEEKPLAQARSFWALAFGAAKEYQNLKPGDKIDLVYYPEINEFNGRRELQLKIVDLRLAENNFL